MCFIKRSEYQKKTGVFGTPVSRGFATRGYRCQQRRRDMPHSPRWQAEIAATVHTAHFNMSMAVVMVFLRRQSKRRFYFGSVGYSRLYGKKDTKVRSEFAKLKKNFWIPGFGPRVSPSERNRKVSAALTANNPDRCGRSTFLWAKTWIQGNGAGQGPDKIRLA